MPRHLELIERAAHHVCRMETLCPLSLATYSIKPQISFSLKLCGLNKTLIHRELSHAKLIYIIMRHSIFLMNLLFQVFLCFCSLTDNIDAFLYAVVPTSLQVENHNR